MNKVKFIFNVLKTMNDKKDFRGTIQAKMNKSQGQVFSFTNEFNNKGNPLSFFPLFGGNKINGHSSLSTALEILNKLEIENQEDETYLVNLNSSEFSKDMVNRLIDNINRERMKYEHMITEAENLGSGFIDDIISIKEPNISLKVWVSKSNEIQRAKLVIRGKEDTNSTEGSNIELKTSIVLFK
ncbi:hypothetical protein [Sporosalibacterium faouarense]|uniref:hypothetical protein n=1 Tax=Sporosalibacterium faouarense TaxID=516123 RepID=UPI00192CAB10|nr:hypothetical protein [Sporosalibacterium faouarense]